MNEWMNIAKSDRSCQALNKAEPKLSKKSLKSIWLCLKIVFPKIQCLINVAVNHLNILQWLYIYMYYSNGQNKCHNHWAISYFQSHNKCWQVRTAPLHLELQFDRPHPCPQQPTLPTHAWYVTLWWYLVIVKSHGKWLWFEHIWTLKLTCSVTMNLTRRYGSNPRLPGGEQKKINTLLELIDVCPSAFWQARLDLANQRLITREEYKQQVCVSCKHAGAAIRFENA